MTPLADSQVPVHERLLYSMLRSVVRMANRFGTPVKELGDWLQTAYFHELRSRGNKLHEIAEALGVSTSKAALLSKRLKQNFLRADERVGLPRRIEFSLWAEPLSRARLAQTITDATPEQIDRALEQLVREGRVRAERRGRIEVYVRTRQNSRLVSEDLESRIDALDNLLGTVGNAVHGRFCRHDSHSFARTVSFQLRPQDIDELQRIYETQVWTRILELEEHAKQSSDAVAMDLSILWSPTPQTPGVSDEQD